MRKKNRIYSLFVHIWEDNLMLSLETLVDILHGVLQRWAQILSFLTMHMLSIPLKK